MKVDIANFPEASGYLNLEGNKAEFKFKGEAVSVDLSGGDKHDNWNSFELSSGELYDVNLHFIAKNEPRLVVYEVLPDGSTNVDSMIVVKVIVTVGSIKKYLKQG